MSNVLIGIIGVILFIGLALAGALFLGPRFQEATQNSKASAALQAVTQVTQAGTMYAVHEGKTQYDVYLNGIHNLAPDYLKVVPTISGGGAINFVATEANGNQVVIAQSSLTGSAGAALANSKQICEAVQRQIDGTTNVPSEPLADRGCYFNGTYKIYSRM